MALFADEVVMGGGDVTAQAGHALEIDHLVAAGLDPRGRRRRVGGRAVASSSEKNSHPFVSGNFALGCFTMASPGTSCRKVPTGYSVFATLSRRMRTASASRWGFAFLM